MTARLVAILVAGTACLGLAGCATVERGTIEDVSVVTVPAGASVSSSSGTICISPCSVTGPRRDTFAITITKPGYVTQVVTAEAKLNDAAAKAASSTAITTDILGRIIDVQDGTYYAHQPGAFVVKLDPAPK